MSCRQILGITETIANLGMSQTDSCVFWQNLEADAFEVFLCKLYLLQEFPFDGTCFQERHRYQSTRKCSIWPQFRCRVCAVYSHCIQFHTKQRADSIAFLPDPGRTISHRVAQTTGGRVVWTSQRRKKEAAWETGARSTSATSAVYKFCPTLCYLFGVCRTCTRGR